MSSNTEVLFVKVPAELITWLDEAAERWRREHPGEHRSRSDIVRALLYAARSAAQVEPREERGAA